MTPKRASAFPLLHIFREIYKLYYLPTCHAFPIGHFIPEILAEVRSEGGCGMRMGEWVSDQSCDMFLWIKYVTLFGMNTSWTKIFVIFYLEELFLQYMNKTVADPGGAQQARAPLNVDQQCFLKSSFASNGSKKARLV